MNPRPREIAKAIKAGGMQCNCDLDNWEPELSTGHSHVCRIHKQAVNTHIEEERIRTKMSRRSSFPVSLQDDGLVLVSLTGETPNRRLITSCDEHKPSCKFNLHLEHPEGTHKHEGARYMFERSAPTAEDLQCLDSTASTSSQPTDTTNKSTDSSGSTGPAPSLAKASTHPE